ncbi:MAG: lasso peptide biosynthesis B2 protein [Kordiimonadaceae bacterium]|nr:lasso peptide biosynthesis B2 protein [Kordiimonadaceae bacterium]
MKNTASPRYFLTNHIYPCDVDGHMLVLDLGADQYSSLGHAEAEALRHLFKTKRHDSDTNPEGFEEAIKTLLDQNILTTDHTGGKKAAPTSTNQAVLDMKGYPFDGTPTIRISHFIKCCRAFIRAKFMRRFFSIEHIATRITKRRARTLMNATIGTTPPEESLARIRELVEVFRILKVLFYTEKDQCLFDSLTLIEFLSLYRLYPMWIFGVQMGPFQAHCWVQDGTHIYNDSITHTDFFTPIMSV